MNKEQLRMQMLAGIITEGQYKEKMEEEEVRGKIGKSYPAPGSISYNDDEDDDEGEKITFTPQQKKQYQEALIKKFYQDVKSEDEYEAVRNLSLSSENIIANILSGYKPLKMDWYAEIGDWDMGDEDEKDHPTYILQSKGYDLDEVKNFMDKMLNDFEKGSTNNPQIKDIQSWIKAAY